MDVIQLDARQAAETVALLDDLRVSLFGVASRRLHAALVADALAGRLDCRIAVEDGRVTGVVLAAPAKYWRSALLSHWALALECVAARFAASRRVGRAAATRVAATSLPDAASAVATWQRPGAAWRIVFIGTADIARGRGVAGALYASMMRDRSLVARIAPDNTASLRLHASLGWRLHADGEVVLAVHPGGRVNLPASQSVASRRAACR